MDDIRKYTLCNNYIIIVDRDGLERSQHKAVDKKVSVEPVYSD